MDKHTAGLKAHLFDKKWYFLLSCPSHLCHDLAYKRRRNNKDGTS